MAILKCKMCGGDLTIEPGMTVCECEYCSTKQTVPTLDNEKKTTLFTRANRLRSMCEFDKAYGVYESIVAEFPEEAEAYWGLILCKYGIEYVDDPATAKKIPTCHRSSFESLMDDPNYEMTLEYSDSLSRTVYREEAKQIEELRKGIIEISGKEEPYDIFICYKETDPNGERTLDSVIAQDVYKELTNEGYRVFFSRITLEDKLGQEYEPYIFAALHSSKVMLAFGTDYEYFNAVWVKNEWSRYLQLISQGEKKTLIPCYKGIDAYDMPKEFARLQAQDMGKVGAIQDLIRGIEKILPKKTESVKETVVMQNVKFSGIQALLDRGNMALEDKEWDRADVFFEEVLNQDAKCAEAYKGKMLAASRVGSLDDFFSKLENMYKEPNSVIRYACAEETEHIADVAKNNAVDGYFSETQITNLYTFDRSYYAELPCRIEQKEKIVQVLDSNNLLSRTRQYVIDDEKTDIEARVRNLILIYDDRIDEARIADDIMIANLCEKYQEFIATVDSDVSELKRKAEGDKYRYYQQCILQMKSANTVDEYNNLRVVFDSLGEYESSVEMSQKCAYAIDEIHQKARNIAYARSKKRKKIAIVFVILFIVGIASYLYVMKKVIPDNEYDDAIKLLNNGQYDEAINAFIALNGYKDSQAQIENCRIAKKDVEYNAAVSLMDNGQYDDAITAFEAMNGYKDSEAQIENCRTAKKDVEYNAAVALMNNGQYDDAIRAFQSLRGYRDSNDQIINIKKSMDYIKTLSVGDSFYFGSYNGNALEWIIVRQVDDNRIYVTTERIVDTMQFNTTREDVSWADCTLQRWLNNSFYNSAFTIAEQNMIDGSYWALGDKIHLLNKGDVRILSRQQRNLSTDWWLIDEGSSRWKRAYVKDGIALDSGVYVDESLGVRPSMAIILES